MPRDQPLLTMNFCISCVEWLFEWRAITHGSVQEQSICLFIIRVTISHVMQYDMLTRNVRVTLKHAMEAWLDISSATLPIFAKEVHSSTLMLLSPSWAYWKLPFDYFLTTAIFNINTYYMVSKHQLQIMHCSKNQASSGKDLDVRVQSCDTEILVNVGQLNDRQQRGIKSYTAHSILGHTSKNGRVLKWNPFETSCYPCLWSRTAHSFFLLPLFFILTCLTVVHYQCLI